MCAIAVIMSLVFGRLTKQNTIQTYSEIVSFVEGTSLDESRVALEKKHLVLTRVLMVRAAAAIVPIVPH